jgi:hypothetical protein
LGNELREALAKAAKNNTQSLGQEIRERLHFSFDIESDNDTFRLVLDILRLVDAIARDFGHGWHASERARFTFAVAVSDQINNHKASDAAAAKKDAELDDRAKLEAIITGRTIARMLRNNPTSFSSRYNWALRDPDDLS